MSKELAFSPRTRMGQAGDFRFWILDFRLEAAGSAGASPSRPGFSYQTEPAEMSRRPSLLKSPMPTPSLRKARSSVVFLKEILAGLPSAVGFDDGYGRAGT